MRAILTAILLTVATQAGAECGNLCESSWWDTATTEDVQAELDAGADLMERDEELATTALHWAAGKGRTLIIQTLIDKGADLMARSDIGWTPLHFAAVSRNLVAIQPLLAAGANVMTRDDAGMTPLHFAAYNSHPEIIQALLYAGTNVMMRDVNGWTPLHAAASCLQCQTGVIEKLLSAGADPKAKGKEGRTPWDFAQENENLKGTKGYWALNDARYN